MIRRAWLAALACLPLAASLLLASSGCGLPGGELVVYALGDPELENASVEDGVWESAPWSAPGSSWMPYPPRATVQVEHTLGRTPRAVLVYLSFEPLGSEPAMAAGDLSRVVAVDESSLTVRNETSAAFYARFVAY